MPLKQLEWHFYLQYSSVIYIPLRLPKSPKLYQSALERAFLAKIISEVFEAAF